MKPDVLHNYINNSASDRFRGSLNNVLYIGMANYKYCTCAISSDFYDINVRVQTKHKFFRKEIKVDASFVCEHYKIPSFLLFIELCESALGFIVVQVRII